MKTYLSFNDIELMTDAAKSIRDKLLIRFLSHLGCRISELLAIRTKDIDFKGKTVTILHLKRIIKVSCSNCKAKLGSRYHYCPACGIRVNKIIKRQQEKRRIRVLPIDQSSIDMLGYYINQNQIGDAELIFNINRHRAWQIISDCAKKAGLPGLLNPETGRRKGISPHRLRDAFSVNAMKLDNSGDGLRLLQEHLGHASFNTTAKYRKIAGDEHREWYDRLWNKVSNLK
jgi:integrase/recombinase XerD